MILDVADDFAERVKSAGVSAEQYAINAHRERARRIFVEGPRMAKIREIAAKAAALAEQRRFREERIAARRAENARRAAFHASWRYMVELATKQQFRELVDAGIKERFAAEFGTVASVKSARTIMHEVIEKHGVKLMDFLSVRRHKTVVRARQEFFWLCREHTTLSYPQIGRICGGRDHTTVLHGVRAHQARIDAGQIQWP